MIQKRRATTPADAGARLRPRRWRRRASLGITAGAVAGLAALLSTATGSFAAAQVTGTYRQVNLVSDIPGVARVTDPNLVNPWGMSEPPGGPVWVSDNGANVSTLYTGDQGGSPLSPVGLVVKIPGGAPTGQVFNSASSSFVLHAGGASASALFLFASENGTHHRLGADGPAVERGLDPGRHGRSHPWSGLQGPGHRDYPAGPVAVRRQLRHRGHRRLRQPFPAGRPFRPVR